MRGIQASIALWLVEWREMFYSFCIHKSSAFALSAFAVVLLVPAGWILHHIPEYRHRSPQQT
uniref:Uncharacterized protein n=1 Tax=Nothobranchius furzeri TaxID=105023 RepID=A0A8C6PB82_NOTFU